MERRTEGAFLVFQGRVIAWGCGKFKEIGLLGYQLILFYGGGGKRTKFWEDRWYGDMYLDMVFPSLFSLAGAKEGWVGDVWCLERG